MNNFQVIKIVFIIFFIIFSEINFCHCQSEISEMKYPIESENYYFSDLKFIDKDLGYLLLNSRLFKTTDLGESFSEIKVTSKENHFEKLSVKKNLIVLLTEYGCCLEYTISTDGGNNWFDQNESNRIFGTNHHFLDIESINSLSNFENSIPNWETVFKVIKKLDINEDGYQTENKFYFLNNKLGYHYGRYFVYEEKWRYGSNNRSKIFINKTTNGGIKWVKLKVPKINDIYNIYFEDSDNGYLPGSTNDNDGNVINEYLMRTSNGGMKWFIDKNFNEYKNFIYLPNEYNFKYYDGRILKKNINSFFQDLHQVNDVISYIEFVEPDFYFVQIQDKIFKTSNLNHVILKSRDLEKDLIKNSKTYKINEANNLFENENYSEALPLLINLIDSTITDSTRNFDILFKAAYSSSKLENYGDAIYYYEKALELFINNYNANNNVGVTYEKIENYELARKYYEIAISVDPENKLAINNLKLLDKRIYELTNEDLILLKTYFPIGNPGSYWVYLCKNNSGPIQREIITEINDETYIAKSTRQYFRNTAYYQVNNYLMQEEKKFKLVGSDFKCEYYNPQIGNYQETIFSFPLELGATWKNVLGREVKIIKFNATVITIAGTFTNCLMVGDNIFTYYYAPGIGLVLSQSYDQFGELRNLDELIDFSIN